MSGIFDINWEEMFTPGAAVAETVIRGSLVYLFLFFLFRVALKREAGSLGLADVLLVVLISEAAQNGMANRARSVTDSAILASTLAFWNYALDWLSYHVPAFRRLLEPPPLLLVKDGQMMRRNMRQELITEEELLGVLRQQGVTQVEEVAEARIESDGGISVIKRRAEENPPAPPGRGGGPVRV